MLNELTGYIIGSKHEMDRAENMNLLQAKIPSLQFEEAIYPAYVKIPFLNQLRQRSFERTGHTLSLGELGCLLSHRKVWRKIVERGSNAKTMFLVLESDSHLNNEELIRTHFETMAQEFDLFFWGAWEGHMKLLRSSKRTLSDDFVFGKPLLKTVYCTYGYSLNAKAAAYLLERTKKIGYPVDQFKQMVDEKDLRIGGVYPELINTVGRAKSYIQQNRNRVKEFFIWLVLDIRNSLICYFK